MVVVRPFSSKFQVMIEFCSHSGMAILFCFIIYIYYKGSSIQERTLMNVGYCMMGVILFNIGFNLLSLVVTSTLSLFSLCKRKKKVETSPLNETVNET